MRTNFAALAGAVVALSLGASAQAGNVVFQSISNNGFFTPFNSSNAGTVKYGDGGWLSGFGSDTYTLTKITLGLASFGSEASGTTDLVFTFNDGDPSGLVFGSGATLYSTTITGVSIPGATPGFGTYFDVEIPLPNIVTAGGFNNIGWSVGLANYSFGGSLGFQVGSASGQFSGFYTSNASFYNGSSWSLFSFGGDPNTGVANYTATIEGFITPTPGAAALLGGAGLIGLRRRR